MRGIVTLALGQTGRRGLWGIGQCCGYVLAAALMVFLFAPAAARAGAPPAVPPPPGGADTTAAPAPRTVAPAAAGATAPAPAPPGGGAAGLVISGLDERTGSVRLLVNKSTTLVTARPYKRLSVGQP